MMTFLLITSHGTLHPASLLVSTRLQHLRRGSIIASSHLIKIIPSSSPKDNSSALLTAAKHGNSHLHKSTRYLLDSDSTPNNLIMLRPVTRVRT